MATELGRTLRPQEIEQTRDSRAKYFRFRNQAQHKMSVAREVIEMSRMYADLCMSEQTDGKVFVTLEHRHAQHGVPSAVDEQSCAGGMLGELAIEFGEIHANTVQQNWLDLFALIEENQIGRASGRERVEIS